MWLICRHRPLRHSLDTPSTPTGWGGSPKPFRLPRLDSMAIMGRVGLYDPDASPAIDAAGKDNITNFASGMLDQ